MKSPYKILFFWFYAIPQYFLYLKFHPVKFWLFYLYPSLACFHMLQCSVEIIRLKTIISLLFTFITLYRLKVFIFSKEPKENLRVLILVKLVKTIKTTKLQCFILSYENSCNLQPSVIYFFIT